MIDADTYQGSFQLNILARLTAENNWVLSLSAATGNCCEFTLKLVRNLFQYYFSAHFNVQRIIAHNAAASWISNGTIP